MRYPLAVTSALDCALLTSVLNETDGPGGGGVDIATAEPAVNRWMECKSGLPRGQASITVCFFFSVHILGCPPPQASRCRQQRSVPPLKPCVQWPLSGLESVLG